MKHTKESLAALTGNELIDLVLTLQQHPEANLDTAETSSSISPGSLFSWLKNRRRGSFVTATKRDIMEHFNCTATQYSKCMRALYNDGLLSENRQYGKRILSSHRINDSCTLPSRTRN